MPSTRSPRYDPQAVLPLRQELTNVGFRELLTTEDVDALLTKKQGTVLLMVNSVCGCAAGSARPGAMLALQHSVIPDACVTVFAGMELDAVDRARGYIKGYAPSSPCLALFKDGEVVAMVQRTDIERRSPEDIARALRSAFDRFCTRKGPSISREEFAKLVPQHVCGSQIPLFGQ
jgi:putative YphP/YqiW family bacilliredoxin